MGWVDKRMGGEEENGWRAGWWREGWFWQACLILWLAAFQIARVKLCWCEPSYPPLQPPKTPSVWNTNCPQRSSDLMRPQLWHNTSSAEQDDGPAGFHTLLFGLCVSGNMGETWRYNSPLSEVNQPLPTHTKANHSSSIMHSSARTRKNPTSLIFTSGWKVFLPTLKQE